MRLKSALGGKRPNQLYRRYVGLIPNRGRLLIGVGLSEKCQELPSTSAQGFQHPYQEPDSCESRRSPLRVPL
jgi:hypothetical protein